MFAIRVTKPDGSVCMLRTGLIPAKFDPSYMSMYTTTVVSPEMFADAATAAATARAWRDKWKDSGYWFDVMRQEWVPVK